MTLIPAEFEKDDDSNHHIDFIAACANLRAEVYTITTTDRATIKKIAGKIIPAISTTTAFVTGGIAMELYKINAGLKKIENYRSCFANLSMPMICFSEPGSCHRYTYGGKEWTNWDHLVFTKEDGRSIDDLADWVEAKYNVALEMIAIGNTSLYMVSEMMIMMMMEQGFGVDTTKSITDLIREKRPELVENHKYAFLIISTDDGSEPDYTQMDIDDLPIVMYEL